MISIMSSQWDLLSLVLQTLQTYISDSFFLIAMLYNFAFGAVTKLLIPC